MSAIELSGISFAFPGVAPVLRDCALNVDYGEIVLVAGASGSGKSTLISIINGIIPHSITGELSGTVRLDGVTPGARIGARARLVGTVLQNPDSQICHALVSDEIAFGCENLQLDPAEIHRRLEQVCELLQLDPVSRTRTLSGGEKQRLMLACALAMGQRILLLDEPFANLDRGSVATLLHVLDELRSRGYAILLVEHRLELVQDLVNRSYLLAAGELQPVSEQQRAPHQIPGLGVPGGAQAGTPQLVAREVGYRIGTQHLLSEIDLSLYGGERVVVVGDNGAGKTTLLRVLAGLNRPTSGRVSAALGARIGSRAWFGKVGYIYQEPSYQLFMPSVQAELNVGAEAGWAQNCAELFEVAHLADRHPQSLSEGEKRRVSIAAVCARRPEVLLLDEPSVGQDDAALGALLGGLNQVQAELGATLVTITHDVRCATALADRVVCLADGRVQRIGGVELAQHRH